MFKTVQMVINGLYFIKLCNLICMNLKLSVNYSFVTINTFSNITKGKVSPTQW